MHVAPADFRTVRTGGMTVRFAILGDLAYALGELPGSASTAVEEACQREHWGFVIEGEVELELERHRETVPEGTAFHVAAGATHSMYAARSARVAGFQPIDPGTDLSDDHLRGAGYEVIRGGPLPDAAQLIPTVAPPDGRLPDTGAMVVTGHRMGDLLFTRATLGRRSGYTSAWCDVPHWGLVTQGALAIEWEDDVEVLTAGDVYACPQGPPGHRLQSAEGATLIDFTPIGPLTSGIRSAGWRQDLARSLAPKRSRNGDDLATTPLR